MEELVNERDEEITRIAKSIEELSQIFKGPLGYRVSRSGLVWYGHTIVRIVRKPRDSATQMKETDEWQHKKSHTPVTALVVLLFAVLGGCIIVLSNEGIGGFGGFRGFGFRF